MLLDLRRSSMEPIDNGNFTDTQQFEEPKFQPNYDDYRYESTPPAKTEKEQMVDDFQINSSEAGCVKLETEDKNNRNTAHFREESDELFKT